MLHLTSSGEPCALVSNIQKYTIHDGPGIRTAVFFTGCTMRCLWCSNPETIEPRPRLAVYPAKCLSKEKCGLCMNACPIAGNAEAAAADAARDSTSGSAAGAAAGYTAAGGSGAAPIAFDSSGVLETLTMRPECEGCFKCADICPPRAIKVWGEKMTLRELMTVIEEDRSYYERTGGGVTLNGGEALLQWEFARLLLTACREASVHTCVETALHCPREHMEAVFEYADLVITDIKHMDTELHRKFTGVGNELVLSNVKRAVELGKRLVIRTPVVPGYNGDEENIRKTGAFIRDELGGAILQYQLLPYRKMGTEKYDSLMLSYPMGGYEPPERGVWEPNLLYLAGILSGEYGLPAVAGSSGKLPGYQ